MNQVPKQSSRTSSDTGDSPAWADGGITASDVALASHCPHCGTELRGAPFCPVDGTLAGGSFILSDRYAVQSLIGAGGMALVFAGQHLMLSKPVAIKVLRPELADRPDHQSRFLREARIAGSLTHDNIVTVLDSGYDPALRVSYLVMERLAGPTLEEVARDAGPLPWRRVADLLVQVCRAAQAAHADGIVHRDLAPKNIMLVEQQGRKDVVVLCDFGLSRLAVGSERITATGTLVGTPSYAAPEQLTGEGDIDARADVYAIGVIAYELLSGRLPAEGNSAASMIATKLRSTPTSLGERFPALGVPEAFDELIMQCLAKDRDRRPATAAQVEGALSKIASGDSGAEFRGGSLAGVVIGGYRVIAAIGSGGLGTVYMAEHEVIGTRAAVKVLRSEVADRPELIDRFIAEARASNEIGSPNIPRYFDFGRLPDGRPYAVMELLEGETVLERLERVGPMAVEQVADVMRQAGEALSRAHAAGIVHRDIKPENLFYAREPDGTETIKLLDFGIAKVLEPAAGAKTTQVGFFLGTPHYCAPEQVHGVGVGALADVYALGATAFEMLTGQPPFSGTAEEVLGTKLDRDAPRVNEVRLDVPARVAQTIASMLARPSQRRPPSMAAVIDAVDGWDAPADDETESFAALAPTVIGQNEAKPARRFRRPELIAAVAGALAMAAVALFALFSSFGSDERTAAAAPDAGMPAPMETASPEREGTTAPPPSLAVPDVPDEPDAGEPAPVVIEPPTRRSRTRRARPAAPPVDEPPVDDAPVDEAATNAPAEPDPVAPAPAESDDDGSSHRGVILVDPFEE